MEAMTSAELPRLASVLWELAKMTALWEDTDLLFCSRETFADLFKGTRTSSFPDNPIPERLVVRIKALGERPARDVVVYPSSFGLFGQFRT